MNCFWDFWGLVFIRECLEFHLWDGKAIFLFRRAKSLKSMGNLWRGTIVKSRQPETMASVYLQAWQTSLNFIKKTSRLKGTLFFYSIGNIFIGLWPITKANLYKPNMFCFRIVIAFNYMKELTSFKARDHFFYAASFLWNSLPMHIPQFIFLYTVLLICLKLLICYNLLICNCIFHSL